MVLLLTIIAASVWLIVSQLDTVSTLINIFSSGRLEWLLAGVTVQLGSFLLYAWLYKLGFTAVGVKSRIAGLAPLLFSAIFISTVLPAGGAATAALFIDDAVHRGQSGARAAVGLILVLVADLATMLPFILAALAILSIRSSFNIYDTLVVLAFLALNMLLIGGLVLARLQPALLHQALTWVQRTGNRIAHHFKRADLLAGNWAEKNTGELCEAALAITTHPRRVGFTAGVGCILHFVSVLGLYTLFLAFRQPVDPGILIAGFGMGMAYWTVGITPQGIGVVEGIMAFVFTILGVPSPKAIAIALAFRGLYFWLPMLIGLFLLTRLRYFRANKRQEKA